MTTPFPAAFSLNGRHVLVTGASSGIGRACAQMSAELGARLTLTGRDESRLQETLASLKGEGHRVIAADLTNTADRDRLIASLGAVDGLVHCAGIGSNVPFKFLSDEQLQRTFEINYFAPMKMTRALMKSRLLNQGGSIVHIASTAGLFAARAIGAYSGSKGALIATSRVLALELAPLKIRVNSLAPAMVRTPLADQVTETVSEESMAEHEKHYPLGFGAPEDVGHACAFLLAPASRWITGTTIVLDGGHTCQ